MTNIAKTLFAALAASLSINALGQTQGVSANEIVLGTIQDLSGPIAAYGKQARNGIRLRVDEINAAGGVNNRKIRVVVEDNSYDPKKSVLATQKLVSQDKVFAILGHIGTAHNMAAMAIQFERNVINFLPLTGSREMFTPFHRLKFSFATPYYDVVRVFLPMLAKQNGYKRVGIIYQDDEYGLEVLRGAEAGLKTLGTQLAERTSFKRGATDFSSQVAKLKAANCDAVVLGTIIRETVGTIAEARKTGFNPAFIGNTANYTHLIHTLGGKAVEGMYAVQISQHPYLDDASPKVREWAQHYKEKFGEDATVFSVYGYMMTDIFAKAAQKAGANLTTDSFIQAMETTQFPRDMFGTPEFHVTKTNRLGINEARLAQIKDGKWTAISDYVEVRPE